MNEFESSLPAF